MNTTQLKYIKNTVMPSLHQSRNYAHLEMLNRHIASPVHFSMDRNSQNDLILRGKDTNYYTKDFEWTLPYQQMAIELNRPITVRADGNSLVEKAYTQLAQQMAYGQAEKTHTLKTHLTRAQEVIIETVYFGLVDCVKLNKLSGVNRHLYDDCVNKLLWLQTNATSWEMVFSTLSFIKDIVANVVNQFVNSMGLPKAIARDLMLSHTTDKILIRSLLRQNGNTIANALLRRLSNELEDVQAFSFCVQYKHLDGDKETGHFFDWVHNGSLTSSAKKINRAYFDDGFTNQLYDCVFSLLTGFSSAWKNQQIIEKSYTSTQRRKSRQGKTKKSVVRYRQLQYDVTAGNIVKTKTISDGDKTPSIGGVTVTPHQRAGTLAYVWVTDHKLSDDEEIFDVRENKKGTELYKVLRHRKGCSVNGGGKAPIIGKIQSM